MLATWRTAKVVAGCSLCVALGCAATDDGGGRGPGGGKADGWEDQFIAGGSINYVNGVVQEIGQILGGAHQLLIPVDEGREPIDDANKPARLHPALKGAYMKFDPNNTSGEAEWDVFASSWFPQSQNGVAARWSSSN